MIALLGVYLIMSFAFNRHTSKLKNTLDTMAHTKNRWAGQHGALLKTHVRFTTGDSVNINGLLILVKQRPAHE